MMEARQRSICYYFKGGFGIVCFSTSLSERCFCICGTLVKNLLTLRVNNARFDACCNSCRKSITEFFKRSDKYMISGGPLQGNILRAGINHVNKTDVFIAT